MKYIEIENFLDDNQKKAVWHELDAFANKDYLIHSGNDWTTSKDDRGQPLAKSSYRMFPNIIYSDVGFDVSPICRTRFKVYHMMKDVTKNIPEYRLLSQCENWSSIAHYYEESGHYKPHTDRSIYTALLFLAKDPTKFTGGDLKFEDLGETAKFADNKLVFFPSYLLHESTPLKFKEGDKSGFGKITLSYFFTINFDSQDQGSIEQFTRNNA